MKSNNSVCHSCAKKFSSQSNLNRHLRNLHGGRKQSSIYVCTDCNSTFSYKYCLLRHQNAKHTNRGIEGEGRDLFECDACGKTFHRKDNLRRHIISSSCHFVESSLRSKDFICDYCNMDFSRKCSIKTHILKVHLSRKKRYSTRSPVCPLCSEIFATEREILHHFEADHHLQLIIESHSFQNENDFISWLTKVEKEFPCSYPKCRSYSTRFDRKEVYVCHRTGFHLPVHLHNRRLKTQGTKKINGFCPSKMVVSIPNTGVRNVQFTRTHIGHSLDTQELAYKRHLRENRNIVADKLAAGVSWSRILEEMTSSSCKLNSGVEKINFLTKTDIRNIACSRNPCIAQSAPNHPTNESGIKSWVTETLLQMPPDIVEISIYDGMNVTHVEEMSLTDDETNFTQDGEPVRSDDINNNTNDVTLVEETIMPSDEKTTRHEHIYDGNSIKGDFEHKLTIKLLENFSALVASCENDLEKLEYIDKIVEKLQSKVDSMSSFPSAS